MLEALGSLAKRGDVAVIVTDTQGKTLWVSHAVTKISGYTAEELIGKTPGEVLQCEDTDDRSIARLREGLRGWQSVTTDLLNRRKDGTGYWIRLQIAPWEDDDGTRRGFIGVQSDITHEIEVLNLALRSRARVLNTFTHELRTPLNAIIQLNDLLTETALDEQQRTLVDQSRIVSQGLLALVNDALRSARAEHIASVGSVSVCDLRPFLARLLATVQPRRGEHPVDLSFSIGSNLPRAFHLHTERLFRVLLNLASNALKYTEQGFVRVAVSGQVMAEATDTWRLEFAVEDSGAGMSSEQLTQLVKPYSRIPDESVLRQTGTGLGLVICDDALREIGSSLNVQSSPGSGSRFSFSVDAPVAHEVLEAPVRKQGQLSGLSVLLVDDNPIGLLATAGQLRRFGAQVVECADAITAIETLRRSPGESLFNLVLMDLQMPDIDGFEATRRIRQTLSAGQLPIIALTASDDPDDERLAAACGMQGIVQKPFTMEALFEAIDAATGDRGADFLSA